ncbi:Spore maturation protein CgeB [Thermoactinomyces sp. DSM 45891]|uniref:CgeB family protein n=1 Tax=Thermoactinomyces sp. DSM 45891 TaxID=1761907 RepID=UPI000912B452|nr:DUF3880 domain-containing protein [Thermoactinomyces sp. DSM 45891]SFX83837.1 Spore maturation protein CgeB [Thermoactinomyces sp. DSM 45891]
MSIQVKRTGSYQITNSKKSISIKALRNDIKHKDKQNRLFDKHENQVNRNDFMKKVIGQKNQGIAAYKIAISFRRHEIKEYRFHVKKIVREMMKKYEQKNNARVDWIGVFRDGKHPCCNIVIRGRDQLGKPVSIKKKNIKQMEQDAIQAKNSLYQNKRILFVNTGIQFPYGPIEQSIAKAISMITHHNLTINQGDDILRVVQEFKPDLVMVLLGHNGYLAQKISLIRKSGIKTALWATDDPYFIDLSKEVATHYDYVFTIDTGCIRFYQKIGCQNVFHLPLATDPEVFRPMNVAPFYQSDICFVGSLYGARRIAFFNSISSYLLTKNVLLVGLYWDQIQNYSLLQNKIRLGWTPGEEAARYYNGAKIVINLHREHNENLNYFQVPALSINNRTFEVASCGSFQLTDIRPDLNEFYKPGLEIETFKDPNEFVNKIEYYLKNERERQRVKRNALKRTLRENTYEKRLRQLLDICFS